MSEPKLEPLDDKRLAELTADAVERCESVSNEELRSLLDEVRASRDEVLVIMQYKLVEQRLSAEDVEHLRFIADDYRRSLDDTGWMPDDIELRALATLDRLIGRRLP